AQPVGGGAVAQGQRVDGVGQAAEHHQRIAEVDVERQEPAEVAMGGGDGDAHYGQRHADQLQDPHMGAEDGEVEQHDEDVHRHLLDGDVDARGEVGGEVEQHVEGGVADGAVEQQQRQVAADGGPVAPEGTDGKRQHRQQGAAPAQDHQGMRVDVADGELAGDDVAAPEQGGEGQHQV